MASAVSPRVATLPNGCIEANATPASYGSPSPRTPAAETPTRRLVSVAIGSDFSSGSWTRSYPTVRAADRVWQSYSKT